MYEISVCRDHARSLSQVRATNVTAFKIFVPLCSGHVHKPRKRTMNPQHRCACPRFFSVLVFRSTSWFFSVMDPYRLARLSTLRRSRVGRRHFLYSLSAICRHFGKSLNHTTEKVRRNIYVPRETRTPTMCDRSARSRRQSSKHL